MVHDAGEVGVGESDASEGSRTEDVARGGLAVFAKKESWLRVEIGVSPAIKNDSGDVSLRVESRAREHVSKLVANLLLILFE